MDELVKIISNNSCGVLDGVSDVDAIKNDEIKEIEQLVGMSIEDIRKIANKSLGRKR